LVEKAQSEQFAKEAKIGARIYWQNSHDLELSIG
jgi:hypothetical protein